MDATDRSRRLQMGIQHDADSTEFRSACREISSKPELKRLTDEECETPFSPYGVRIRVTGRILGARRGWGRGEHDHRRGDAAGAVVVV